MTLLPSATAIAYPNIALIKYWGKRDEALILPMTGSLSLTLDVHATTTTVSPDARLSADAVEFNGTLIDDAAARKVAVFLDLVRQRVGSRVFARVRTRNDGPTAAGLASSASGFAALAAAAAHAYGLELTPRELSRLARRGSGSASRSVFGGFAIWHAGQDDASSFAEPVQAASLDVAMVMAVIQAGQKAVSSRVAMRCTVETSPFYPGWLHQNPLDLEAMQQALAAGDFTRVGELTEANALRMHATMLGAMPPVRYLAPDSLRILDEVAVLRQRGVPAYATMDAGPNVKVLCQRHDALAVADALRTLLGDAGRVVVAHAGPGVRVCEAEGS